LKYNILEVKSREILDSRGNPTIEVEITLKGGATGRAAVPSGASTGTFEAIEIRDNDERYHGKGVVKAINIVNEKIKPKIIGIDARDQKKIDRIMIELDGTENKSKLGGNTILGVSIANIKAVSKIEGNWLYEQIDKKANILPVPFFNVINGGKHAGNQLDFQEFMIAPTGAKNFRKAIQIGSEIYQTLKENLRKLYGENAINVGDEGGFSPPIANPKKALEIIMKSVEESGYAGKTELALDVAASSLYENGTYKVENKSLNKYQMIDLYKDLVESYPIVSIEDPLFEDDYEGYVEITKEIPIQILGDDIFVTNTKRLKKGIKMKACNALLWKVNQIGSLTEALDAAKIARKNGYKVMASHRSGDTEDTFVADLSVGIGCGQIKSGAPCRGERTAKYNQLLRIEENLGKNSKYPTDLFSRL
jgi:enolase